MRHLGFSTKWHFTDQTFPRLSFLSYNIWCKNLVSQPKYGQNWKSNVEAAAVLNLLPVVISVTWYLSRWCSAADNQVWYKSDNIRPNYGVFLFAHTASIRHQRSKIIPFRYFRHLIFYRRTKWERKILFLDRNMVKLHTVASFTRRNKWPQN